MDSVLAQIESLLDKILKEEETLKGCFLIDLKKDDQKVSVFLDGDHGLTHGQCKLVSRKLEAHLDENLLLGEKYTLEVSSPGADGPLKLLRQYHKHVGRKIRVHLEDETEIEGVLKSITDESLEVEEKKGKGKKAVTTLHKLNFEQIIKSYILLAF